MHILDLTCETAEENIALDEALVTTADEGRPSVETLRIWEAAAPMVVVGRSTSIAAEVNLTACEADQVPVIRRSSGGASIVAAPGCLMYGVVLDYQSRPDLRLINRAHDYVLEKIAVAVRRHVPGARRAGISDLAVGDRKFSGNSMRCCRRHLLYHGTLLYSMDLDLVEKYLLLPPRQPDYRQGRTHRRFVTNLEIERGQLVQALIDAWNASQLRTDWPRELTERLVLEKYSQREWNFRHA